MSVGISLRQRISPGSKPRVVELRHDVARCHNKGCHAIRRKKRERLGDAAEGFKRFFGISFLRVADRDPPLVTVPELSRELIREMRSVDDEIPDSGPDECVYLPVDHPLPLESEKRFWCGVGERAHAFPPPGSEDQSPYTVHQ